MKQGSIENLIMNRVSWLADSGPEDDIAISSRIRLARNIKGFPFPINAGKKPLEAVIEIVEGAMEKSDCFKDYMGFRLDSLSKLDRMIIFERRLISKDFLNNAKSCKVMISEDERSAIMINEEDHLRMQVMRSGLQLGEVWKAINSIDDSLDKDLDFAFNSEIGFLTSCPTNLGTGMRASVMLHLPGLFYANQINSVIQAIHKLGLAARGIFGEGTENLGNLYQISNQSTLGEKEEQIIERLESVIKQIIMHEKNARQKLLEKSREFLLNQVGRAYGILKHAYIINSQEALNSLSALRLGVDMGMFSSLDIHTVNELFVVVQPAHLQKYACKVLNSPDRDVFRAKIIREKLNPAKTA